MTRKDFNLIATAIRNADIDAKSKDHVARVMALELRTTNPRFDMMRFVDACTAA
jgi:hypothetical protein